MAGVKLSVNRAIWRFFVMFDLILRRRSLYPAELRLHIGVFCMYGGDLVTLWKLVVGGGREIVGI